jgi:hypothetical protein
LLDEVLDQAAPDALATAGNDGDPPLVRHPGLLRSHLDDVIGQSRHTAERMLASVGNGLTHQHEIPTGALSGVPRDGDKGHECESRARHLAPATRSRQ